MKTLVSAALGLGLLASAAQAHAVLERKQAAPGTSYRGVVQIMHGCNGKPTTRVSVTIPEGLIGAKPMPKPGWTLTTARGPYAKTYATHHGTVSEGVTAITWSGGSLPDDQVDEFTFLAQVAGTFEPGATVYVPVQQDCAEGSYAWSEIPKAGQDAHDLKAAAPSFRIVQVAQAGGAPPAGTAAAATTVKAGDLTIETPWLRATPNGAKVAGGYVRITNTGRAPDTLTGATVPFAKSSDIHSMSMEGGVMKMAPVTGGLTIKPGETVELKPGGYHLMFEDLTGAPKAGETVAGTLTFQRAGAVPVTFTVAPIGAGAPGGQHQHQH
ncbi:copper chaperone [Methylobacterium radiotolerans]|nr:copper chaperone [Methylobacterium radiotolerans]